MAQLEDFNNNEILYLGFIFGIFMQYYTNSVEFNTFSNYKTQMYSGYLFAIIKKMTIKYRSLTTTTSLGSR